MPAYVPTQCKYHTLCKPSLGYAEHRTRCCNVVRSYAYHTNIKSWATCVGLDHMVVLLLYCCNLCHNCKQALTQDCKPEHAMNNNSRIITMSATKHYMTTMTSHCVMWATKVGWHLAHVPKLCNTSLGCTAHRHHCCT